MRLRVFALALLIAGCAADAPEPEGGAPLVETPPAETAPADAEARALVDRAIAAHGGSVLERAELAFRFRGTPYRLRRDGGRFAYSRVTADSLGRAVEDRLDNEGLRRFVDGAPVPVPSNAAGIETNVNSVAYFALLPFPLRDPAVRLRALGPDTLRGQPYERVEVTFAQAGGGRDWEDRYLYWIHPETHSIDFLAYTYRLGANETGSNATGSRFREAVDARTVEGVRVQDYRNWTAFVDRLEDYAGAFDADTLRLVSEVRLDAVRVMPLR
ncbi:MAG: DUF6503 family protein [Rubricoccaceae bacterium]|nr:DUF6503 family protein [Rubricoccaceae bacterium]